MQFENTGNLFQDHGAKPTPRALPPTNQSKKFLPSNRSYHGSEKSRHTENSATASLRINTWDMSAPSGDHFGTFYRSTGKATPKTPSATSSLSPSGVARKEAEKMFQSFNTSRQKKRPPLKSVNKDPTDYISAVKSLSTTEDTVTLKSDEQDLTLHDLCGESSSTDDVAWRNALHILSFKPYLASVLDGAGWTPLHVACLGSAPPPLFMTRSLLYVYREAAQKLDGGGRLPLHLVAASSGDVETMQLLIQEYPQAIYHTDCQGWNPLHLILKNFSVDIRLNHCRVLLGLGGAPEKTQRKSARILQRRGEHLTLKVENLDRIIHKATPVAQEHEMDFWEFPQDIQASLRRLCQWKRKHEQQNPQIGSNNVVELEAALSFDAETNPAAHFTPVKRQLPIHMIVRRGLSESKKQLRRDIQEDVIEIDQEEPTSTRLTVGFFELVRLFIASYPKGLLARDFNGYTPLLASLSMSSAQPSYGLVELLLGKRTSEYNCLPSWARNIRPYNLKAGRYINPAMIPCKKTHQLPLHVVAEEMADNYSLLSSVRECFPGAIQCQDFRGRTPLHILLRNYRRSPLDPRTVALLLSDDVAQTPDDEGKLPFDLLAENAECIPLNQPCLTNMNRAVVDDVLVFKNFFQQTFVASSEPNVRNRFEGDKFLWQLRSLPPWLRGQACSTTFVQELLLEELASPLKCALIILYAALLCTLIVVFRIQVWTYIENPEKKIPAWTLLVVYSTVSVLFLFQLIFWSICISMSEFLHLCVFNIWRWIDLSALLLACTAATILNHPSSSDKAILAISIAASGMLWFSILGFVASWWYGASLFVAFVQKIATLMFWPVLVVSLLMVGFSQMFYTATHIECNEAHTETSLCSLRESYLFIYFIIIGEPIVGMESDTRVPSSILALAVLFITALFLLLVSITIIVIIVGSNCDLEELALSSFWEPKLTLIISAGGSGSMLYKTKTSSALETAWVVATDVLSGWDGAKRSYWYACFSQKLMIVKACYWLIAALLVPVWLLVGLLTFGLLWPPQVRRFLFRPQVGYSWGKMPQADFHTSQSLSLKNELAEMRDMWHELSNDIQRDLGHLKDILDHATAD